jgi:RNA-directed DNA polymerase
MTDLGAAAQRLALTSVTVEFNAQLGGVGPQYRVIFLPHAVDSQALRARDETSRPIHRVVRKLGWVTVIKLTAERPTERLIEFGPFAATNRRRRGEGKPETFDFLGFTHICAKKRSNGYFTPSNSSALHLFRFQVGWLWHRALSRRSQNGRVLWDRMRRLIDRWLPPARVCHPYPLRRLGVIT